MNKKRTNLEVIRDILIVLQRYKNVKITHIIYKANLSNNTIKPYIQNLLKTKMIEEVNINQKRFFRLTMKGMEFLNEFNKIKVFSDSFGL